MRAWNRRVLFVFALLAVAMLAVAPADAAKGGQGKGGGPDKAPPAILFVTPDPVAAGGATYTVTGEGFNPGEIVYVNAAQPYCCNAYNVMADSSGRVEFTRQTGQSGTYSLRALQKKGKRLILMAEITFKVIDSEVATTDDAESVASNGSTETSYSDAEVRRSFQHVPV